MMLRSIAELSEMLLVVAMLGLANYGLAADLSGTPQGWLGVIVQDAPEVVAKALGMNKPLGALITQVQPDSPAAAAGLRAGDIILGYDRQAVNTAAELLARVSATMAGKAVELVVLRDGRRFSGNIKIAALPASEQAQAAATTATPSKAPQPRSVDKPVQEPIQVPGRAAKPADSTPQSSTLSTQAVPEQRQTPTVTAVPPKASQSLPAATKPTQEKAQVPASTSGPAVGPRGWLGVAVQNTPETLIKEALGVNMSVGALVTKVVPGSPAAAADLRAGDIILFYEEQPIRTAEDLVARTGATAVGKVVKIKWLRNSQVKESNATIAAMPSEQQVQAFTETPGVPQLRIETGLHTVAIKRIAVDAAGRWLVTVAEDKTARVWDLSDGRLLTILRVPVGTGDAGKLYAAALSPDGATVAVGGYDGFIYLFERANGQLKRRLSGLAGGVNHLVFSPDSRYLVATLWGSKNGMRVYRTADWREVARDSNYGSDSYWAAFSPDGRLVTSCLDGFIRLYDRDFRLKAKRKVPGGKDPFGLTFSPDGKHLAVGFSDAPAIAVLDGRNLRLRYVPDIKGLDNGDLAAVAWSADGTTLYAGGKYDDENGMNLILAWDQGGRGARRHFAAPTSNTLMTLWPLADGGLVYGAADPALGLLDSGGKPRWERNPEQVDYRAVFRDGFVFSRDGLSVQFSLVSGGKHLARFDLKTRNLTLDSQPDSGLTPALTEAPGLTVTDWFNTYSPKLNDQPLALKKYEMSRRLAIAPDNQTFLLGTDWYLRLFDRKGQESWNIPVPGVAWGVNISGDGRLALAAFGDGTLRWYRLKDGVELLALFPHPDGKRWVAWTPSGYFMASPGGETLIGWHLNRGQDQTPDFFSAGQFRNYYYRPDIVERVLVSLDEAEAIRLANAETETLTPPPTLVTALPPVVELLAPSDGTAITQNPVTLRYRLRSPTDAPVSNIKVLLDGRPVADPRALVRVKEEGDTQILQVEVPPRDVELSLLAENRHGASQPATVRLRWQGTASTEFVIKPKLYALVIGVSRYDQGTIPTLSYPSKDAQDFSVALKRQEGGLYREVVVKILTDARKDAILEGLDWLERQTTSNDVAMLFLAGHGLNDANGSYYFLPADADPERLKVTAVPYHSLRETLSNLPGKALFFVDTCHAGNILGTRRGVTDIDQVVIDLTSAENGAVVFAASTGKQYALEDPAWGNGAFTKALVEGLDGQADYLGKGQITINMLNLYVAERVKELTTNRQTPTVRWPGTVTTDFPVALKRQRP
jgi:WD40 repeat protein